MPLSNDYNTLVKRFFDIVFSLFIIMFFLSWITPIIALLIKIESSGPVFLNKLETELSIKSLRVISLDQWLKILTLIFNRQLKTIKE